MVYRFLFLLVVVASLSLSAHALYGAPDAVLVRRGEHWRGRVREGKCGSRYHGGRRKHKWHQSHKDSADATSDESAGQGNSDVQSTGTADIGTKPTAASDPRPALGQTEDVEVDVPVQPTTIRSKQTEPSPSPAPASPDGGDNLDSFAKEILAAHNAARLARGANPLTWSDAIASQAKSWAEKCVWHHGGADGLGQNLAAASAGQSAQNVVNSWVNEEKDYNPSSPSYNHFTQVVWKASTQLGCYQARCSNFVKPNGGYVFGGPGQASYTVCNYNPPGNFIGRAAENVQKLA